MTAAERPTDAELAELVRSGLGLGARTAVSVAEVTAHTNVNYVFRVRARGRSLVVKLVPERPKRLPVALPPERVVSEAEAMRRFRRLAGPTLVVPEVLFVDRRHALLAMTDVGDGRRVLLDVLDGRFGLLAEQARRFGSALAAVHGGTRGGPPMRPEAERAIVRAVIFDGLLAPGAKALFPESWDEVAAEMRGREECLVHADLWGKNLLVKAGAPVAVVDFEGAYTGDPAFDLGTLLAVAVMPALVRPALLPHAVGFAFRLADSYRRGAGDAPWARQACRRAYRYAGTFLAARGFGPFAYPLDEAARRRLAALATALTRQAPPAVEEFAQLVLRHGSGLTRRRRARRPAPGAAAGATPTR